MFDAFAQATQRTVFATAGVMLFSTLLGLTLGSLASRRGNFWDGLLMRLLELSGALHYFIAIALLKSVMSATLSTILALGYYQGLRLARLSRNEMQFVRRHQFVLAARALGLSAARTEYRHVFPHALPALAVNLALTPALVVSSEAALAFVGLDDTPSWGALIVSSSPAGFVTLLAIVVLTLLAHLAAERATGRVLPHAIRRTGAGPLATAPDRSR